MHVFTIGICGWCGLSGPPWRFGFKFAIVLPSEFVFAFGFVPPSGFGFVVMRAFLAGICGYCGLCLPRDLAKTSENSFLADDDQHEAFTYLAMFLSFCSIQCSTWLKTPLWLSLWLSGWISLSLWLSPSLLLFLALLSQNVKIRHFSSQKIDSALWAGEKWHALR